MNFVHSLRLFQSHCQLCCVISTISSLKIFCLWLKNAALKIICGGALVVLSACRAAELRESFHLATLALQFQIPFLTSIRRDRSCLNCLKEKDACILLMSAPRKTGRNTQGHDPIYLTKRLCKQEADSMLWRACSWAQ